MNICQFNNAREFLEFASLKKGSANIERPSFTALGLPLGWNFKHSDHFASVFAVGPSMFWMSGINKLGGVMSLCEVIKFRKHAKTSFQIGVDYFKPFITVEKRPNDPFQIDPNMVFVFNIGFGTSLFRAKTSDPSVKPKFSFIPKALLITYSFSFINQDLFQGIGLNIYLR